MLRPAPRASGHELRLVGVPVVRDNMCPVAVANGERREPGVVLGVPFCHAGILPHRRVGRNCKPPAASSPHLRFSPMRIGIWKQPRQLSRTTLSCGRTLNIQNRASLRIGKWARRRRRAAHRPGRMRRPSSFRRRPCPCREMQPSARNRPPTCLRRADWSSHTRRPHRTSLSPSHPLPKERTREPPARRSRIDEASPLEGRQGSPDRCGVRQPRLFQKRP